MESRNRRTQILVQYLLPAGRVESVEVAAPGTDKHICWPETLHRYGVFLLVRPTDAERQAGFQQLREAEDLARRLGMARLVIDINAVLHPKNGAESFPDDLTAREVDVLRLLAIGRTNKDVSLVWPSACFSAICTLRFVKNAPDMRRYGVVFIFVSR